MKMPKDGASRVDRLTLLNSAAKQYLGANLSIIPIFYQEKDPDAAALRAVGSVNWRGKATWKPYRYRLPSMREIEAWFATPERNIAIVTGFQSLIVLDFDVPEAYAHWSREHAELSTRTAVQKSGQGFHIFFRLKKQLSPLSYHHFILPGFGESVVGQVKGMGGCVTSWPSIHPTGALYSWLGGQAPWENGILSIGSLSEVGVSLVKERANTISFLLRFLTDPTRNVEVLRRRYMWFFREWFGETREN
jgi:hypothetical protein